MFHCWPNRLLATLCVALVAMAGCAGQPVPVDENDATSAGRRAIEAYDGDEFIAGETIPAKYNTETVLGIEVATQAAWKPGTAPFDLTSN